MSREQARRDAEFIKQKTWDPRHVLADHILSLLVELERSDLRIEELRGLLVEAHRERGQAARERDALIAALFIRVEDLCPTWSRQ